VLALAAAGATVPFLARYRRQQTGGLDARAVRRTLEAREQFEKILARQRIIVESIERHAQLEPALRERILATFDPDALEDLYHPYRQQKKNRAQSAREAGLQQLADWIWNCGHGSETPHPGQTLELWAFTFRDEEKGIPDAKTAIEGARDILVERLAGDPELRALVRRTYLAEGVLRAAKTEKAKPHSRFEPYFAFEERLSSLREPAASQRYLSLRRGQADGELQLAVGGPQGDAEFEARLVAAFEAAACTVPDSPGAEVLRHAGRIAFKNDVRTAVENEVHRVLREAAELAAAQALAEGVSRLLLQPPFGRKPVLGIDPGARGCRAAAVDAAGGFVAGEPLQLQGDEERARAREAIVRLARAAAIEAVAVGDGSGAREAELFTRAALREAGIAVPVVLVGEAGASSYSTSEPARAELPSLEPADRAVVSIARRLQDPLAELVKLEPRSLAAGQYQHDIAHAVLQRELDAAIESCVDAVGVDVNTASAPLLGRVAGLGAGLASAIVKHREQQGPFRSRRQLAEMEELGAAALEQAAAVLRVRRGEHPLDDTGVHPEHYARLEAVAERAGKSVAELVGPDATIVREQAALRDELGELAFNDLLAELAAAGRDPRGPFVPFSFREDLVKIEDLKPGMSCPGIVNNVTAFGAFVDVGVQQDGLVHLSQLGKNGIKDPREAVQPGDRVTVRVLKVDLEKKQISLSMRPAPPRPTRPAGDRPRRRASTVEAQKAAQARRPAAPVAGEAPAGRPPRSPRRDERASEKPTGARDASPPRAVRSPREKPERAPGSKPVGTVPPGMRRAEPRQAFNNPFAVLAGLQVPPKRDKG
jgi:uncharacterized protein